MSSVDFEETVGFGALALRIYALYIAYALYTRSVYTLCIYALEALCRPGLGRRAHSHALHLYMCPDALLFLCPRVRCRHYAGPGFDAEREFARKWEGILEVLKELKDKSSGVGVAALQRSELAHRLWDSRCPPSLFGLLVQKYKY